MSLQELPKNSSDPQVWLADAADQNYTNRDGQFPGLYNDTMYPWAMVDTEDGKRYGLFRALCASAAMGFSIHECSTDRWTFPRLVRSARDADLYWGQIMWLESERNVSLLALTDQVAEKHSLTLELGPDRIVWKDDDAIDIVFTPICRNVTTIYMPGLPGDAGYTSAGYSISGWVNGSRVTGGYGGIDRMYVAYGLSAHTSKVGGLENYWINWGSLMEDGTWHTGNVFLGEGDLATATFNQPGEEPVIALNQAVRSTVEWDSNGEIRLPKSATLAFGGRTFEWQPTHNAAFNGPAGRFAHLQGSVQEVGGPKPVKSWSTMEIIKARATPRNQV
jgi:hypothetical protein